MMRSVFAAVGLFLAFGALHFPKEHIVLFWNVENFFDTFYDAGKEDGTFTPWGAMHWSAQKFTDKRNAIAKTIIAAGGGNSPVLIGLAEVENRYVLNSLIRETPLSMIGYSVIHRDSPDRRGIDVALLYREDAFRPLMADFIPVVLPDTSDRTRSILYVKGVLEDLDTVHVYVNHWPSKLGGARASEPRRSSAARALKSSCDSVLKRNSKANIIIMGDFNDTPDAGALSVFNEFFNLCLPLHKKGEGTIKYRGEWELIDQILISYNLLDKKEPISVDFSEISVYAPDYLLENDRSYSGMKPRRTYIGQRYNGGISDHLPVRLVIRKNW